MISHAEKQNNLIKFYEILLCIGTYYNRYCISTKTKKINILYTKLNIWNIYWFRTIKRLYHRAIV